MGKNGRYGKYGENKRFERLRKAGTGSAAGGRGLGASRAPSDRLKSVYKEKIKIMPAKAKDADYIRRLSKTVFTRYGPYDDTLTDWFTFGVAWTVLASRGKRPVGFAMLGRSVHEHPTTRVYELLAIAVEPEMQRLGIGNRLLREINRKARELSAETLVLHTSADNAPGRKLFRKHGFIPAETKEKFYPGGQDALMMYKTFLRNDSEAQAENKRSDKK
jgi:ribosomal protein S18 acetylase RimI-like enzyme